MSDSIQDLILTELRSMRAELSEYTREAGERLATLEAQMRAIAGNGRPGRLDLLEKAVRKLEGWRWYILGGAGGASGVVSIVVWLVTPHH